MRASSQASAPAFARSGFAGPAIPPAALDASPSVIHIRPLFASLPITPRISHARLYPSGRGGLPVRRSREQRLERQLASLLAMGRSFLCAPPTCRGRAVRGIRANSCNSWFSLLWLRLCPAVQFVVTPLLPIDGLGIRFPSAWTVALTAANTRLPSHRHASVGSQRRIDSRALFEDTDREVLKW